MEKPPDISGTDLPDATGIVNISAPQGPAVARKSLIRKYLRDPYWRVTWKIVDKIARSLERKDNG